MKTQHDIPVARLTFAEYTFALTAGRARFALLGALVIGVLAGPPACGQADLGDATQLYRSGKYRDCIKVCAQSIQENSFGEAWRLLLVRAHLAIGENVEARTVLGAGLDRYQTSIRLRWLGRTVCLLNDDDRAADRLLEQIDALLRSSPARYRDTENQIVLGQFLLHRRVDAKTVLQKVYDPLLGRTPNLAAVHLASGDLALSKHDYGVAATCYRQAIESDTSDPRGHYGLAQALAPSDAKQADEALQTALRRNPHHVDSLLFVVDHRIDAEDYAGAKEILQRIEAVNPRDSRMWAYRAVLAHLENDPTRERHCRNQALATWSHNPAVDHLIGKKLSQKYRFAEGAAYQRTALKMDDDLQAQMQLSQDLLRLGQEAEGWKLAHHVHDRDGYNVVAYNLVTLQEHLAAFTTLENQNFILRMDSREAEIYGPAVLALLRRAEQRLCQKYDVTLTQPVTVEIFPRQEDFAVRTFGLPGGGGYLGVCFGHVITANSPASTGSVVTNWQATLWHEFCHVVTLQKTRHKMPRWLSEGISVYEERLENPTWGQSLTPAFHEMLQTELTPVSQLSSAFLRPQSGQHLLFAYFESSLVVQYFVEQYGLPALKKVLDDLAIGMPASEALGRHAGSIAIIDKEFAEYARSYTQSIAPDLKFQKPELPERMSTQRLATWCRDNPHNFWALSRWAQQAVAESKWQAAKTPLQQLIKLWPTYRGPHNPYQLLATAHRELGETEEERAALQALAAHVGDAPDVYLRLAALAAQQQDWPAVRQNGQRLLAVNPLRPAGHRYLVRAAQGTADTAAAIPAYRSLLLMDPVDPAETHFQLAQALRHKGDMAAARRHVIMALEEAPRYRAAHRALLEIVAALDEQSHAQQAP